jgi:hypothetical protein
VLSAREIVEDCARYGSLLRAWEGAREIGSAPVPVFHGPLPMHDARKFTLSVHSLLRIERPVVVYRFYETAGLLAPFGQDHPSYVSGAVRRRVPAGKLGGWWSPRRPSLMIDGLGHSSDQRQEDRRVLGVNREWNRFDTCVEATLVPGSLVFAGRTAPQAEDRAFETDQGRTIFHRGGTMQFLLVRDHSSVEVRREYHIR